MLAVVTLHSPQRHWVAVQRSSDDRGERVVILAGWGQPEQELFRAVLPHLAPGEVVPVARALGVPVPAPQVEVLHGP